MPDPDLPAVRSRYQLAREAGRHMDPAEGGGPLTRAGYAAVVASWQDVAPLHDALRRAAGTLAAIRIIVDYAMTRGLPVDGGAVMEELTRSGLSTSRTTESEAAAGPTPA